MDLTLAGIVAGIAAVTGVVAYEGFVLIGSTPEPAELCAEVGDGMKG